MKHPPPRKPGSQVAPGQRPLFTDGRTATTHSKIPIDQATAGRLYRVRDKHVEGAPGQVWGQDLPWDQAVKLKEQVVVARKSMTARVEDMEVPLPAGDLAASDGSYVTLDQGNNGDVTPVPGLGAAFELVGTDPQTVPARGVLFTIPPGHELLVDGQSVQVPALVAKGAVIQARALDPGLAAAQAAALAAARPVAQAAQRRLASAYRDKTVTAPQRRQTPPPRDRTVSKEPPFVRLGAPPAAPAAPPKSPLKVATETDGDPLAPGAMTDTDVHDLDVGGGPSDEDVVHAKRLRDETARTV